MKQAWLCYNNDEDVVIHFQEPCPYLYGRIVKIVYMEIIG
tara:strand:+ start:553 stop:672 length:120 start_codon:yes stop_codon:yes gene_type:complete